MLGKIPTVRMDYSISCSGFTPGVHVFPSFDSRNTPGINSRGNALLCISAPCSFSKDCRRLKCTLVRPDLAWLLQRFSGDCRSWNVGMTTSQARFACPFLNIQKSMQNLSEGRRYLLLCLASPVKILPFPLASLFCSSYGTNSLPKISTCK